MLGCIGYSSYNLEVLFVSSTYNDQILSVTAIYKQYCNVWYDDMYCTCEHG